ncbi:hemoglobin cathodic subunit beta-like [Paramormyrops kingsleyae]|uniref:Hemoglobin subunit epsilon 1 n=1 Tax=Paramormyrops kingsleyae TaxID=1676925 RepID=A0A3B3QE36_9TELE|nr:hemoglobin cathodic subunit beta-like [Paramormyrops kingsleyae]
MVKWTDAERATMKKVWEKVNINEVGPQALARLLIVYPWTQRYFGSFGDLSSPAAIVGNPKVAAHGKIVLKSLDKAVKNLDGIKNHYVELSEIHSEKLHVDPDNFRLLGDCVSIVLALKFGSAFNCEVQNTFQKFLAVVIYALSRQYY